MSLEQRLRAVGAQRSAKVEGGGGMEVGEGGAEEEEDNIRGVRGDRGRNGIFG